MRRTRLRRESGSHRKLRLEYEKEKAKWMYDHPGCQFEVLRDLRCNLTYPVTLHHKMGRGKYLAEPKHFMTLCLNHHQWVEDNKREARRLGYILYQ